MQHLSTQPLGVVGSSLTRRTTQTTVTMITEGSHYTTPNAQLLLPLHAAHSTHHLLPLHAAHSVQHLLPRIPAAEIVCAAVAMVLVVVVGLVVVVVVVVVVVGLVVVGLVVRWQRVRMSTSMRMYMGMIMGGLRLASGSSTSTSSSSSSSSRVSQQRRTAFMAATLGS